jgi:hypothetical protein
VLSLAIWLASGTLAPYAATFFRPIVSSPCGYLYNVDHPQHEAAFLMLDGAPPERWQGSLVLRRLLFPLIAYPFMKLGGFEVGGFVASLACQLAALLALARHLRRRHGEDAARVGIWLTALYPGITYWAALPYAYVTIVPASIALFILLANLDDRLAELGRRRAIGLVAGRAAAMGVFFTAYDLVPFFGLAALILLARRRRWLEMPGAVAGMAAAPLLVSLLLAWRFHVGWTNTNTAIYSTVLGAYLHPPALMSWARAVADVPLVLVENFFFSNMVFLPAAFVVLLAITRLPPSRVEAALLVAVGLVFLFNNLAPPDPGRWQMRGDFISRLYQPVFVALVVYVARAVASAGALPRPKPALAFGVAVLAIAANATVAFGPIARLPWAGPIYAGFYLHSPPGTMDAVLAAHGRRPLGFCRRAPGRE